MYSKIMLAYDGSENSKRAAKEAVQISSQGSGCCIEIVYVADYDKSKYDVLHSEDESGVDRARREMISSAEILIQQAGLNATVTILHGAAGPSLVEYANSKRPDVFVIGSRGLNSLQEMVLGSVSHKVMKRVKCPVLVVK